ncbi:MAG: DEAD/DEAH box helicase family protein [Elusimicrobia bacterium]|nr:DEAD/DEAH box helicase family protein [Elusimicrobiota bacterium]
MKQVVIENPIINSAFEEPKRQFRFSKEGITNEIEENRRVSSYFVPIPRPKKKGAATLFETEWTLDRIEDNKFINQVRSRVSLWRQRGYPDVTKTTARLLEWWRNCERDQRLFFCQIEAAETAIYITEAAKKQSDAWIENDLRQANEGAGHDLYRIALKMATGSGKTVVMAMLIAWQTLNKLANPKDSRFSDAFLVVTPGITIRDRLRVLLPSDPQNYYRHWDLIPPEFVADLGKAKVFITNFHAFKTRELSDASRLTKSILSKGKDSALVETPDQMVRRVCRDLGNKQNIIVINDEAHHCYRRRQADIEEIMSGEERREAEKREEEARVWISGLEAVKKKIGVKMAYDLSATPFFLRGSGYQEGTLFPWVVSDFSLIDAIESGIVKVPRVPVADDQMKGDQPTYRDLWRNIREHLPKKGRNAKAVSGEPHLPKELQGALHSLYSNYEKHYGRWENNNEARVKGQTPPVFIVVCNNTNVSKLVYDYIAGWEKQKKDGSTVIVPGQMPIFNNEENGKWLAKPNTILIDSQQLESGEGMSPEFKKMVAAEIEEFKAEYRARFPGRDAENLTDEDLLREVMNTVGKPGKLGEHVKCVVSVSMLTEGWDATTVTHILGVRAFGTQLLCEQVVGRGLRRMSHALNEKGLFTPEYAEVYGVPISFIPCSGSTTIIPQLVMPTRVRALEERLACEITFPRVMGYRYDLPSESLKVTFGDECKMAISTADIPTRVDLDPIVGESSRHTLDDLGRRRPQEAAFVLARRVLEKYFRDDDGDTKHWLFPQLASIAKDWMSQCLILKDNAFPQLLLISEFSHEASDCIYKAISRSEQGEKTIKPILRPYDAIGSTRYVDFSTVRPVYPTHPDKCHVSHVVADTSSWEQKMAQALEEMDEVVCYVKNQGLGFCIPYTLSGEEKNYMPDFIVHLRLPSPQNLLNLIVEVTGERKKDKVTKVDTARLFWIPAINNHGEFGRWAFIEISDPWDAQNTIRATIKEIRHSGESRNPVP